MTKFMCRLVESIRIDNGIIQNISRHSERFNRTRRDLFGSGPVDLAREIIVPDGFSKGMVKCRVIYGKEIKEIIYLHYQPIIVKSFMLVYDDTIDYTYKYIDRSAIDSLFALRGQCDDILIVKRGLISDASSSNAAFFNGREWHTPAVPLLRGTCLSRLLDEGLLIERDITPESLSGYQFCSPFNAMRDPGEIMVPVSNIFSPR